MIPREKHKVPCPACAGLGAVLADIGLKTCELCAGTGSIVLQERTDEKPKRGTRVDRRG